MGDYKKIAVKCSDYEYTKLFNELEDNIITSIDNYETQNYKKGVTFRRETKQDTFRVHQYLINGSTLTEVTGSTPNVKPAGCKTIQMCSYGEDDIPNKLNFENMFEVRLFSGLNYDSSNKLLDEFTNPKIITLYKNTPALVLSSAYKIGIDFKLRYNDKERLPANEKENDDDKVSTSSLLNGWYLPVQIKLGDKYYDNEVNGWVSNPFICKLTTDLDKKKHFTFDWLNAKDTNDYTQKVGNLSGHIIDLNSRNIGKLEITVYCPIQEQDKYNHRYIYIKDLSVKVQRIEDIKKTDYSISDTLYENTVNEDYVNELDDIELKLTSNNSSELALSRVAITNQTGTYNNLPVDSITNKVGYSAMKLEELLINRIINQYKNQKISLNCNLNYNNNILPYTIITEYGKRYMICGGEIDFNYNTYITNLIEII